MSLKKTLKGIFLKTKSKVLSHENNDSCSAVSAETLLNFEHQRESVNWKILLNCRFVLMQKSDG